MPTSWISSANKDACLAFLEDGKMPEHKAPSTTNDDTANALMAAIRAVASGSLDADAVRLLIQEETAGLKAETIDENAIRKIVDAAVNECPPIRFNVNGTVHKVDGIAHPASKTLAQLCAAGVHAWVFGEAGSGKTTTCRKIAEAAGMQVFVQPPSLTRYDVLGYTDAHSRIVDTPTSRFVRATGPKALLFDEVDSYGDGAQIALNLMLANGHAELPDGTHPITTDDAPFWIVCTANTTGKGATSSYVGRKRMDGAFLDRFAGFVRFDIHEPTERKIGLAIIAGANADTTQEAKDAAESFIAQSQSIRASLKSLGIDAQWSPRKTLAGVKLILNGMTPQDAVRSMTGNLESAQQTAALALVN